MPRMPSNNRIHSSGALQVHGIWVCAVDPIPPSLSSPIAYVLLGTRQQTAIGYDPYAPVKETQPAETGVRIYQSINRDIATPQSSLQ